MERWGALQAPARVSLLDRAILCPGLRLITHTYPASTYQLGQQLLTVSDNLQAVGVGCTQTGSSSHCSAPYSLLTLGFAVVPALRLSNCSGSDITLDWESACRQCHKLTWWLGSSPPPCLAADIVCCALPAGSYCCLADFVELPVPC